MKTTLKILLVLIAISFLAPEASAIFGVRRRCIRRTAVVVGAEASAMTAASAAAAANAQQQAAVARQQAAASEQQAAQANAEAAAARQDAVAPPPAETGKPLPLGTVVAALPSGCVATPVGGEQYYYGGGNFYRAVFQGGNLVYVTVQPK